MAKKEKKLRGREIERQKREAKKREKRRGWILSGGAFFLVIGAIAIFTFASRPPELTAAELDFVSAAIIDGPADAPIQIIEYGDFGCPACRQWHRLGIKDQIQAIYGDQVAFHFHHFPVITPQSPKAAEASMCAAEQGKFWEYHDFVYDLGDGLSVAQLESYATSVQLDGGQFSTCLDSGKYQEYVSDDLRAARASGARGTPAFFINGQMVANPSFEMMAGVIRQQLEES